MKTNLKRISKRSLALILGILMLFSTLMVGTITANAWDHPVTLNGQFNNGEWKQYDISSGTCSIDFPSTQVGKELQFEIGIESGDKKYTATSDITYENSVSDQTFQSDNYRVTKIKITTAGTYTFTYNSSTHQFGVTYPGGSIGGGDTNTVYFKNTVNWSNVYVYLYSSPYWNAEKGSGSINAPVSAQKMTLVDGTTDVYSYEYTGDYRYISFTEAAQADHENFYNTKAAYRGDLNTAMSAGTPVYVPSTTSSGTYNGTVYYNTGEWKTFQIGDTVTEISGLTENKATNKIIANTNTSAMAQSAWLWDGSGEGTAYKLTEVGSLSTQYLSYYSHSMSSPNAIFFQGTVTDGSTGWPGNTRITTKDVKASNGLNVSADGHTSIIDGNYYFVTTSTESDQTKFTVFDHIGGTITPDQTEITTGQSITLTGAATAGTLRQSKIGVGSDKFTYVVRDSGGKYYRIGDDKTESTSVTWVPTVGGTYTVCGLVTDPFGFESIKVAETTVTVNDPVQQKYTVTYSAGANGSMTCAQDTVNVESGSQVVADTNVTFTITPEEGYEVDTFTVNGEDKKSSITNNTYTHTVQADVDVQVTFKKTTYTITVDSGITGGTVTPSATSASIGDIITFTSTPETAYFQKSVTVTKAGGGTVTCTNNSFIMPAENVTISATFVSYRITGSLTTAGTSNDKDTTWDKFDKGMAFDTKVSDTIYSKTITLVESDFTNDNQRNKFRLKSNDGVVYRPNDSDATDDDGKGNKGYLITKSDSETNSYATKNGTSSNFFYFDTPGEYTIFIQYVDGGNPKIWAVRGAFNLTSTTTKCTVKFYSDANLTTEITKSKANRTVYVKVTPDTNCQVKSVSANSELTLTPVSGKENLYSFTMPSEDVNVTATAETIKKTVTFTFANSSLSVSYVYNDTAYNGANVSTGDTITVDKGTTLSVSAVPNTGYQADGWVVTPTPTPAATTGETTCSFTVSDNTSVTFKTKKIDYSISYVYNSTQGGTSVVKVNDAEVTKLNIGDKFKVEQTVNTSGGYEIDSVEVKAGNTILYPDAEDIYTMQTGDVTVTTTYKAIKPTISNCPTETVEMYAGASYTIPATTDYGTLSYSEPTGDFTFSGAVAKAPNKEGNYTITVTATNMPAGITTAATTTATFNITVKFTETQKAYKVLQEKFAQIGHENSDYYENNEAWTAYEKAVSSANTLLATFPPPTATNTDAYVNAKTTLQNAYDEIQKYKKVNTIYVLSKYAPGASNNGYVNIHMFNKTTGESYEPMDDSGYFATTDDHKGKSYHMTNLGTVTVGSENKRLYKFEFFGKADFLIFVGTEQNTVISDSNKLTGDIETCKGFTSYYIDIKDVSASNSPSKTTYDKSPYEPLSVELTKTSDACVEDAVYDLTRKIPKIEGGTLKTTSGVTVNHTYSYTLNGDPGEINDPTAWIPADPGVYTITVTSSNGITDENKENTFTLYVQDKLDKPILAINGISNSNTVTVNNETNVVLSAISSGADYPEGAKYIFTVDGTEYESNVPTYTFAVGTANALALGNHKVSVKVIAPDTKYAGTEINQYLDSEASDGKTVKIDTVKYTYKFDFTECHVATNTVTFKLEGNDTTVTDLKGSVTVDKNSPVTFTVTMSGKYVPIPNENCWSGVTGATIGADELSYSFTASNSNADSTVVFRSYLPVEITPDTQKIKINASAKIGIKELDSNASYQLLYKKTTDTKFMVATATLTGKEFATSNLPYGKYQFKVRQYTDYYSFESNVVDVNAIIGTVELEYYYRDYKSENGISYDPYIGKENNLSASATKYSVVLEDDISSVVDENDYATLYKKYAPNLSNNYFNYTLVTTGVTGTFTDDKTKCTITGPLMTPTEKTYTVSINGVKDKEFTSYYQQKTFLLDASKYCTAGTCGYVWYYVDSEGKETVVSTSQYYKLRVARNTNLKVKGSDKEITTPTTTINEPVYTEIISNKAVKVQMSMLVENYLPEGAVRTRTGVVYYSYEGNTAPAVDSSKLPSIIANSATLANGDLGKTYTVGTESGIDIKGYYTNSDNVNGKFIFAPIASINSTKTYVVYSYLTYIQDNVSVTIISSPVTASVALYKQQITTS